MINGADIPSFGSAVGQPANVQGLEPVTDPDADYLSYIEKLKEHAIFTTSYTLESAQ